MIAKAFVMAVSIAAIGAAATVRSKELGKPGITPAPCPDQAWEEADSTFEALPGAKVSFGHYDGGTYRLEIPEKWNGELVLWAHGCVASAGAQGSRLRVGVPGVGQGSPFREHLIEKGFAWAASQLSLQWLRSRTRPARHDGVDRSVREGQWKASLARLSDRRVHGRSRDAARHAGVSDVVCRRSCALCVGSR